ncbi:hypothetical protein QBC37DRAFT_427493 [Rhypophila decipiens]|uniref:Uncharacterized protein n=1 Tax=Rhypophila decipiens TaxID=261697 RepID=A0AAN6Y4G5_9PEZI|nr:hypothetical protein QBC37DRAFT_427493 [Rhypophila decipiens]
MRAFLFFASWLVFCLVCPLFCLLLLLLHSCYVIYTSGGLPTFIFTRYYAVDT